MFRGHWFRERFEGRRWSDRRDFRRRSERWNSKLNTAAFFAVIMPLIRLDAIVYVPPLVVLIFMAKPRLRTAVITSLSALSSVIVVLCIHRTGAISKFGREQFAARNSLHFGYTAILATEFFLLNMPGRVTAAVLSALVGAWVPVLAFRMSMQIFDNPKAARYVGWALVFMPSLIVFRSLCQQGL